MNRQETDISNIPQAVWDAVELDLRPFFVSILAQWKSKPSPKLKLVGSGTLVQTGGREFILTAGHVWNAAKDRGADTLDFVTKVGKARIELPCDEIRAMTLWDKNNPEEWGPDLALLEIPKMRVGTFKAQKSFLNLDIQKKYMLKNKISIKKTIWGKHGTVGVWTDVSANTRARQFDIKIYTQLFITGIQKEHVKNGFDYYDDIAAVYLPGIPDNFGGVSGGGLWQFGVSVSKSGQYSWDGKRRFCGVAFWQSCLLNGQRSVRFHGPKSIYERMWNEFGL